jgi:23S rRNA (uracil1939-C5)-methyltransferase
MAKRNREEQILENLTIESIAAEGKCIAHVDGMVVFVEYAVPGDVVNARVLRKKKNYAEARIIEIVKPSEYRQKPFCEHFGVCGGCRWQLIPYQMQLDSKRQQVADQFRHIGHLNFPEVSPTIGSDKTEFYRNKLEFTASDKRWILPDEDPEGIPEDSRQGLGFHVGKFFDKVLDIRKCYLQPEPSNAVRLYIKQYAIDHGIPFYNIRENSGIFRNMFVRTTDDGQVMLIVCFAKDFDGREAMLDAIAEQFPQISSLYYIINSKLNDSIGDQECILYRGDEAIYETMEGLRFRIGPKSFYQTNNGQALKLYSVAREFAALSGSEVVYDLYTGTGTIAQFVSRRASRVIGIEYVPEAIEDAKINARGNGIDNCEFFAGDMKDILTDEFIAAHGHPDVIIADPPRAGMHPDVIATILNAAPERIVYVSCNPASQARDLEALCTKYEITAVQPVDMFPHTTHVENVCRLELKTPETDA